LGCQKVVSPGRTRTCHRCSGNSSGAVRGRGRRPPSSRHRCNLRGAHRVGRCFVRPRTRRTQSSTDHVGPRPARQARSPESDAGRCMDQVAWACRPWPQQEPSSRRRRSWSRWWRSRSPLRQTPTGRSPVGAERRSVVWKLQLASQTPEQIVGRTSAARQRERGGAHAPMPERDVVRRSTASTRCRTAGRGIGLPIEVSVPSRRGIAARARLLTIDVQHAGRRSFLSRTRHDAESRGVST